MCGISGYLGTKEAFTYILKCLKMLENRGYDSAGICTLNNKNEYILHKFASRDNKIFALSLLEDYKEEHNNNLTGIGHTRWATHGAKTDINSHPHVDNSGKFILVHNGIIENFYTLKKELKKEHNIVFKSETDTEVIVNLINIYYEKLGHVEEAIIETTNRLEGTWGLAVLCTDKPDNLYCARHGSPLLIGFGGGFMMVSSEQSGFCNFVNNYICLENNDVVVIKRRKNKVTFEKKNSYQLRKITIKNASLTPDPYPYWTIKEIYEQYDSTIRAISMGARLKSNQSVQLGGLNENKNILKTINNLILLGCGTSYHSGLHAMNYFLELSDFNTVQCFDGAEFYEKHIPKFGKTALVLLSQSGETRDLHRCIRIGREKDLFMIGVINVVDSQIARDVNCGAYLNAGREVGVASTKSFTSQLVVLSMMAIWFAQIKNINLMKRKEYIKNLRQLPTQIKKTILNTEQICKKIAKYLVPKHDLFILGKESCESIAKEGALKIKEVSYINAQGYGGNSLRHGPYAIIKKGTPIIFITPNDEHVSHMKNTIQETHSRGADNICITDSNELIHKTKFTIRVEPNNTFKGLLHNIPMQLIAYYVAIEKGHSPDKIINLSKVVSV